MEIHWTFAVKWYQTELCCCSSKKRSCVWPQSLSYVNLCHMSQIVSVYLFTACTGVHVSGSRTILACEAGRSQSVGCLRKCYAFSQIHSIPGDALGIFRERPLGRICGKRNLMEFVENLKKDSLHLQSFFDFFDTLHPRIPYSLYIK